jgi:osmotically inducible protein OsmC
MTTLDKVLYTARAHTTGGRDGASKSDDGRLDVTLSSPGAPGTGTNPEQLFAAGYSACFIGAMKAVAGKMKVTLPADLAIDAEVDLGPIPNAYGIAARLNVSLPGMDRAAAQAAGGRRPPGVPLLQRHARQHRRDDHPGLSRPAVAQAARRC